MPVPVGIIAAAMSIPTTPPVYQTIWVGDKSGPRAYTANRPDGTTDGDYLVAVCLGYSDTITGIPSGWSLIHDNGGTTGGWIRVYGKVASGEPATYAWEKSGASTAWRIIVLRFSNCAGVDAHDHTVNTSGATITWPVIATTSNYTLLVAIVHDNNSNARTFNEPCPNNAGTTELWIDNADTNARMRGVISTLPGPSPHGNSPSPLQGTASGNTAWIPVLIALKS